MYLKYKTTSETIKMNTSTSKNATIVLTLFDLFFGGLQDGFFGFSSGGYLEGGAVQNRRGFLYILWTKSQAQCHERRNWLVSRSFFTV